MQYRHDKKIISSHDLLAIDVFSRQKLRDARTGMHSGKNPATRTNDALAPACSGTLPHFFKEER